MKHSLPISIFIVLFVFCARWYLFHLTGGTLSTYPKLSDTNGPWQDLHDHETFPLSLPNTLQVPETSMLASFSEIVNPNEVKQAISKSPDLVQFLDEQHQYTIDTLLNTIGSMIMAGKTEHDGFIPLNSNIPNRIYMLHLSWVKLTQERMLLTIQGAKATMKLPNLYRVKLRDVCTMKIFGIGVASQTFISAVYRREYTTEEVSRIREHLVTASQNNMDSFSSVTVFPSLVSMDEAIEHSEKRKELLSNSDKYSASSQKQQEVENDLQFEPRMMCRAPWPRIRKQSKERNLHSYQKLKGATVPPKVNIFSGFLSDNIISFNQGKGFQRFSPRVLEEEEGIVSAGSWEDIVSKWESKQWKNPKMGYEVRKLLQNVRNKSMGPTGKQQIDVPNEGYIDSFYLAYEELPNGRTFFKMFMLEGEYAQPPDSFSIYERRGFSSSESYDAIHERPPPLTDVDVLAYDQHAALKTNQPATPVQMENPLAIMRAQVTHHLHFIIAIILGILWPMG